MKRFAKSILGVTLLEIMLVLAIAAMVIVMSVRYYQSAQTSSQVNAYVSMVQAYTAAAENLAQGTGFSTSAPTAANVYLLLPGCSGSNTACRNLPWSGSVTYAPAASGFTLASSVSPTNAVCTLISSKFTGMTKYTVPTNCAAITYNAAG